MVVGVSEDKERAQVLRLRPESAELGELRPMRDGVPLGDGEIVELRSRPGSPQVYDVDVKHTSRASPTGSSAEQAREPGKRTPGPAKVSTESYRAGWERIFSGRPSGGASN
jgi:hypothetical protein